MIFSTATAAAASALLAAMFLAVVLSSSYTRSLPGWAQGLNIGNALFAQGFLLVGLNIGDISDPRAAWGMWIITIASALGFGSLIWRTGILQRRDVLATNPHSSSTIESPIVADNDDLRQDRIKRFLYCVAFQHLKDFQLRQTGRRCWPQLGQPSLWVHWRELSH
jgi:hypothetical protein